MTNHSDQTIILGERQINTASNFNGDPTDSLARLTEYHFQSQLSSYSPGLAVALDGTCTVHFTFNFVGTQPPIETDHDSGTQAFTACLIDSSTGLSQVTSSPVEVTLYGPAAVPEPASVLLFGTGILLLSSLIVRRRIQA